MNLDLWDEQPGREEALLHKVLTVHHDDVAIALREPLNVPRSDEVKDRRAVVLPPASLVPRAELPEGLEASPPLRCAVGVVEPMSDEVRLAQDHLYKFAAAMNLRGRNVAPRNSGMRTKAPGCQDCTRSVDFPSVSEGSREVNAPNPSIGSRQIPTRPLQRFLQYDPLETGRRTSERGSMSTGQKGPGSLLIAPRNQRESFDAAAPQSMPRNRP